MAGNPKSDTTGTEKDITCIDDVPGIARLAARQQFLAKWYRVLALAPFAAIIFIAYKFFPNSNSWIQVVLVFVAIIWGMVCGRVRFLSHVCRAMSRMQIQVWCGREMPFLRLAKTPRFVPGGRGHKSPFLIDND